MKLSPNRKLMLTAALALAFVSALLVVAVLLVRAADKYPLIRQYSTDNYGSVYTSAGRAQTYRNSNALVREGTWQVGLQKTGYIREAGRSMVVQANVQNQPLVIVLLNSPTSATRVNDARSIQTWIMSRSQSL